MKFSLQEKQKAIKLAQQLGIEVSFDNEVSGIFIGDSKEPTLDFEDVFSYVNTWTEWAKENKEEEVVIEFINSYPNFLNFTGEDGKSITPEEWHRVSIIVNLRGTTASVLKELENKYGSEVIRLFRAFIHAKEINAEE